MPPALPALPQNYAKDGATVTPNLGLVLCHPQSNEIADAERIARNLLALDGYVQTALDRPMTPGPKGDAGAAGAASTVPGPAGANGAPGAPGAAGATGPAGAVANMIDVNAETTIVGPNQYNVANNFPAAFVISDGETPADFNIFLPSAPVSGALVFFRVRRSATKLYCIYGQGKNIDGIDRRFLQRGESCMLRFDGTEWTKIGGVSLPLVGQLKRATAQPTPAGGWSNIVFSTGTGLCFDATSGAWKSRRPGRFRFAATFVVEVPSGYVQVGFSVSCFDTPALMPSSSGMPDANGRSSHNYESTYDLGINAAIVTPTVNTSVAGSVVTYATANIGMTYEEIITW
jgi:hypothetical protein